MIGCAGREESPIVKNTSVVRSVEIRHNILALLAYSCGALVDRSLVGARSPFAVVVIFLKGKYINTRELLGLLELFLAVDNTVFDHLDIGVLLLKSLSFGNVLQHFSKSGVESFVLN